MVKIYKAKRKKEIEGREKPLWIDAAFTVIIGDWQGRETMSLIDERTGERFPCFEIRQEGGGNQPRDTAMPPPEEDDIPF
jgi:hypothetical protein